MGKELRRRTAGKINLPEDQVQKILQDELEKHMAQNPINPLIGMPGQRDRRLYTRPNNCPLRRRHTQRHAN
jgi:hypothetical protein